MLHFTVLVVEGSAFRLVGGKLDQEPRRQR
jgi:hypothetical protein